MVIEDENIKSVLIHLVDNCVLLLEFISIAFYDQK